MRKLSLGVCEWWVFEIGAEEQEDWRVGAVGGKRESKACRRGGCGCLEGSRPSAKLEQRVILGENQARKFGLFCSQCLPLICEQRQLII